MKVITLIELHSIASSSQEGELILDVRTPAEFAAGHLPGAKNIPVDQVASRIQELRSFKAIHIYCKAGGRATTACNILESMGLNGLTCYQDGGFPDWVEKGYSVE